MLYNLYHIRLSYFWQRYEHFIWFASMSYAQHTATQGWIVVNRHFADIFKFILINEKFFIPLFQLKISQHQFE